MPAGANAMRTLSAKSLRSANDAPFPDRCALLLDPAMMEQARRAAALFQMDLLRIGARIFGRLGRQVSRRSESSGAQARSASVRARKGAASTPAKRPRTGRKPINRAKPPRPAALNRHLPGWAGVPLAPHCQKHPQATARGFGILPFVITVFYFLVLEQILQGFYSLWQGVEWLKMARRRLGAATGFYAPRVALICPVKGMEQDLEGNLSALTHFDYPQYEIFFAVAAADDPAYQLLERVASVSKRPVHIVRAGRALDCSDKVHNLRRSRCSSSTTNLTFWFLPIPMARPPRRWLARLVAPLADTSVGAATTFRWLFPSRRGFWNALRRHGAPPPLPTLATTNIIFAGAAERPFAASALTSSASWTCGEARPVTITPSRRPFTIMDCALFLFPNVWFLQAAPSGPDRSSNLRTGSSSLRACMLPSYG